MESLPLALLHNREASVFSYECEKDKLCKDFIGSSFIKALSLALKALDIKGSSDLFINSRDNGGGGGRITVAVIQTA